jgi:hypothetical protein
VLGERMSQILRSVPYRSQLHERLRFWFQGGCPALGLWLSLGSGRHPLCLAGMCGGGWRRVFSGGCLHRRLTCAWQRCLRHDRRLEHGVGGRPIFVDSFQVAILIVPNFEQPNRVLIPYQRDRHIRSEQPDLLRPDQPDALLALLNRGSIPPTLPPGLHPYCPRLVADPLRG